MLSYKSHFTHTRARTHTHTHCIYQKTDFISVSLVISSFSILLFGFFFILFGVRGTVAVALRLRLRFQIWTYDRFQTQPVSVVNCFTNCCDHKPRARCCIFFGLVHLFVVLLLPPKFVDFIIGSCQLYLYSCKTFETANIGGATRKTILGEKF